MSAAAMMCAMMALQNSTRLAMMDGPSRRRKKEIKPTPEILGPHPPPPTGWMILDPDDTEHQRWLAEGWNPEVKQDEQGCCLLVKYRAS
jgi:hypothetical protein